MFVKEAKSGDLIKIVDVGQLIDPTVLHVCGRRQAGEEEQDPADFCKQDLVFPSGETLPKCWQDTNF